MKVLVATSNQGKLREVREVLEPLLEGVAHQLVSLEELGLAAPDETGVTFQENAAQKARESAARSGLWTLADDSGLCVDALGGGPGIYSARFAPTDEERRAKLLRQIEAARTPGRGAHFFCAVALCAPDGERVFRAEGRVDGSIAEAPRGAHGFGYDPLFLPRETPGRTLAELPPSEKNRLSHRGRALQDLAPLLERLLRAGNLA
ncbi:MAG TPA: RdgB/HAM1 family non-canonical purine NTP pyrophosphatase [Myxococcales bacterium]|jgi:XTP/dITP diphosphohydrolase|nr:RdgB/HAM1 family non-canonical purine NTP pyrophosphatase [Myxococcales bacterium]